MPEGYRAGIAARSAKRYVRLQFISADLCEQGTRVFRIAAQAVPDGWIDQRAASFALEQLSFGITTSSTRSAIALMGYLSWRQAFIRHCAATGGQKIAGLIPARPAQT